MMSAAISTLWARSEADRVVDLNVDETLFWISQHMSDDSFGDATKYYTTPVDFRRRGLDWWVVRELNDRFLPPEDDFEVPQNRGRVRVAGSSRRYAYSLQAEYGGLFKCGWYAAASVEVQMGRDLNIDGVFSQNVNSQLHLGREFVRAGKFALSLDLPHSLRGVQSSSAMESILYTGDNLYNPSCGLYQGEMRNSRVSLRSVGELSAKYDVDLSYLTKLSVDIGGNYGRRSVSRLGWYDAYNPSPDYYRKMPSYLADGDLRDSIEAIWRDGDSRYTQIAWDDLVVMNQQANDRKARYMVEDQVVREMNFDVNLLFRQKITQSLTLSYGGSYNFMADRLFKEVDDLLGADYHLDIDQYTGDYYSLGNDMQNDLRNPNRRVVAGDRFGYDYTRHRVSLEALLGVNYRIGALDIAVDGRFGDARSWREGHYEKERFAGDASYGDSREVKSSVSSIDLMCGYTISGRHNIALHGAYGRLPQDHRDMFVDEQSANVLVRNLDSRRFRTLSLSYGFRSSNVQLSIEGYYQRLTNQNEAWSGYDDISYTYTDIIISGISTKSIGFEGVFKYRVNRLLSINTSVSVGDYTYDSSPLVELYSSDDMELLFESTSVATEGCKVGNAPQMLLVGGVDLNLSYGFRLSLNGSYAAGRYVSPSFARRTDRVLRATGSADLSQQIIEQRALDAALDVSCNVMRSFDLSQGRKMALYLRVDNLLGERDRASYGRESSRILRGAAFSTTSSYYLQADEFIYTTPRTFYLSCSYNF